MNTPDIAKIFSPALENNLLKVPKPNTSLQDIESDQTD